MMCTRNRAGREDGVALVAAVGVVMVVGLLMLVVATYALGESSRTGRDRQRSSAIAAAEGRLDTMLSRMQGAAVTALPCTETTSNGESAPDTLTTTTTTTYYVGASAVACPVPAGTVVTQALVRSTSVSNTLAGQQPARRTIESLVQLRPLPGNGLNMAVLGYAGVTLSNQGDLYGSAPGLLDADIYTNGNFTCANNGTYRGSVYSQGTISLQNKCDILVDAHARLGFTATSPSIAIGGDVLVSAGNARLKNGISVAGAVRASGTITNDGGSGAWSGCSTAGKCYPGSVVAPPPTQPFPKLNWDPATRAEWVANGYTGYVENNDCAGSTNGPAVWLRDQAQSITVPTILRTTCQVKIANNATLDLGNNVAVFADGGIDFKNSVTIKSTTSTLRYLYLIQPYNAVPSPCTATTMSLLNQVTVEPTVRDLLYSPCTIRKANQSTFYGQVYAGGQAIFDNRLELHFDPLPVWGLVDAPPAGYAVDIQYKREATG